MRVGGREREREGERESERERVRESESGREREREWEGGNYVTNRCMGICSSWQHELFTKSVHILSGIPHVHVHMHAHALYMYIVQYCKYM